MRPLPTRVNVLGQFDPLLDTLRAMSEPFSDESLGPPRVRGFIHHAIRGPGDAIVLTHGAGGDCTAPVLFALASAFASRGVTALRCDLPYRQAKPTGPPSPARAALDREGLRHALAVIRRMTRGKLYLGGHSYGGRQASMLLAADAALADGLLLLSYPLHPPRRGTELRTAHFPELMVPTFFVHGTADAFASPDELGAARRLIGAPTGLLALEGARHDLHRGRPRPGDTERIAAHVVAAFLEWIAQHSTI
jgi:predicted alpha/beta-hydrolase family hydrolase